MSGASACLISSSLRRCQSRRWTLRWTLRWTRRLASRAWQRWLLAAAGKRQRLLEAHVIAELEAARFEDGAARLDKCARRFAWRRSRGAWRWWQRVCADAAAAEVAAEREAESALALVEVARVQVEVEAKAARAQLQARAEAARAQAQHARAQAEHARAQVLSRTEAAEARERARAEGAAHARAQAEAAAGEMRAAMVAQHSRREGAMRMRAVWAARCVRLLGACVAKWAALLWQGDLDADEDEPTAAAALVSSCLVRGVDSHLRAREKPRASRLQCADKAVLVNAADAELVFSFCLDVSTLDSALLETMLSKLRGIRDAQESKQ